MNFDQIKQFAEGRGGDIITALTALPIDVMTKRAEDHPCPNCNSKSTLYPDVRDGGPEQHGRIACRFCTEGKPTGDIIDTVKVFGSFGKQIEAAKAIADFLGISDDDESTKSPVDIITAVAKAKRMPEDAFRLFGAEEAKRGRDKKPVARVPVYNASGDVHSHFDLTPKDKGFFKRGKGSSGMFFPGKLPKPGETWHLVEGVKDAAALTGLGFDAAGLPRAELPRQFATLFDGVHVITVADLDEPGQKGAQRTGGHLSGVAASVKAARLPGEVVATKGDDVRDVLRRDGEQAVRDAIANSKSWEPRDGDVSKDDRPIELLTLREAWHIDRVIEHLGRLGWDTHWIPERKRELRKIYQRGGALVEVVAETKADQNAKGGRVKVAIGTPRICPIPPAILRPRIAESCQLMTEKVSGDDVEQVAVPPPKWLTDGVFAEQSYGDRIRHLEAIVTAPTIRPDGSILQTPGWDASGLLYRPSMDFAPVPDKPTQADARKAAAVLAEVVADFPFTDDADRSAWVAMVLSMIGRPCVTGQVPMFCATANIRGAGKSMLIDAASIIAYGHGAARTAYASDDDEMRKRITSIVIEGAPAVLLDNIDRPIGGAALDAVLTAERWKDRELGSSRTIDLPARAVWTATGNNLRFRSDIARRVIPIRLDSPLERPETRTDFHHTDLIGWTRANRAKLVTAALVMLRAYFVAECPKQPGGQFGSYETWSDVIRGAIVWAGCADPMDTIKTAQEDDESAAIVLGLIRGLCEIDPSGSGLTCREIVDKVSSDEGRKKYPTMREVVGEHGSKNGRPDSRKLGYSLRKYRGRVAAGFRLLGSPGHAGTTKWVADREQIGGDGGDEKANGGDDLIDHHHTKHCNLPGETPVGGDGGDTFLLTREKNVLCDTHGTQHVSYRDGPESSPSSPPSPPNTKPGEVTI